MSYRTVPICDECWRKERGAMEPVRLKDPQEEVCYACDRPTRSGIYVRRHLNLPQSSSDQP